MRSVKENHTVIQGVTSVKNNLTGDVVKQPVQKQKRKLKNSGNRGCAGGCR